MALIEERKDCVSPIRINDSPNEKKKKHANPYISGNACEDVAA